jgi:hypothetical protein
MKESNKYCVFAFKDHYVNQACERARKAKMDDSITSTVDNKNKNSNFVDMLIENPSPKNNKIFSAQGYCVFQDCPVKFFLKMNSELTVHVNYTGNLKHSVNEVRARYFRGKSRQELREVLKTSTPTREYKNRVKTLCISETQGNVDYVGRTKSVYKRISAEAKDSIQNLSFLRKEYIKNSDLKLHKEFNNKTKLFQETYLRG